MIQAKSSPPPHRPPADQQPRSALVRRPGEGVYSETMPADQDHDADVLQAALLGYRARRLSPITLLGDWLVRLIEWAGRIVFNWFTAVWPRRNGGAR